MDLEKRRKYSREYIHRRYHEDPNFRERFLKSVKKYQMTHPYRVWARYCICRHRRRGFTINITRIELERLARKTDYCKICGVKLAYGCKGKSGWKPNSPSLDRINNSNKEISLNSIQIICSQCNSAKHQMSIKQFVAYCKNVFERNHKILL